MRHPDQSQRTADDAGRDRDRGRQQQPERPRRTARELLEELCRELSQLEALELAT